MKLSIRPTVLIGFLIAISTIAIYWQIQHHDFLILDDGAYVTENTHVKSGLSMQNIRWAFSATEAGFWQPLVWLSLMLDYELYRGDAGGFHWTSLMIHISSALLLFLSFNRMTKSVWRSGMAAMIFTVHPINIEPVCWVSSRKDVLSTFFFMLTVWTYARYAEKPVLNRYVAVFFAFLLGIMSKPMIVTLPFVLLLLDYWPLGRFRSTQSDKNCHHGSYSSEACRKAEKASLVRLITEKLPFIAISLVAIALAFYTERKVGAISSLADYPLDFRFSKTLISYIIYIRKIVWPNDLSIYYSHEGLWPFWQVILAGLVLITASLIIVRKSRSLPYLIVGWLWYLGTLVPVIGIIQISIHAMADRYLYIPAVGLYLIIVWGIADILQKLRHADSVARVASFALIASLMATTWVLSGYWVNSEVLFRRALALDVSNKNYLAHYGMGVALGRKNAFEEAVFQFRESVRICPTFYEAQSSLGQIYMMQGKMAQAEAQFADIVRKAPNIYLANQNLAHILFMQKKYSEAIVHYRKALMLKPSAVEAHNYLGVCLMTQGKIDEAITHFQQALSVDPTYGRARVNLNNAIEARRRMGTRK